MFKLNFTLLSVFIFFSNLVHSQDVPIINSSVNSFGQIQLEIEAQSDMYYLLHTVHEPNLMYESITSMFMGVDGNLILSEPVQAFDPGNYAVKAHPIAQPLDTDGDGIDDVTEFNNMPSMSPFNFAEQVPYIDGTNSINNEDVYSDLAVVSEDIPWAPFLNNQAFVKFAIVNQSSDEPEVFFINSKTHDIHASFLFTIGVDLYADDVVTGEIVYNPNEILPNGAIGSYAFNYSFGNAVSFEITRRTFELLAANMPFLKNNMVHFIGNGGENNYLNNYKDDYEGSRISVVLESEFFADVDFLPFNKAEGFGFFKKMELDENPASRDIVLYDALPNSLPRVGGIITSVVQTPLSHVNLRAIQDNVPNAYIKEPLAIDSINNLLGKYIYYRVDSDNYVIREASLDEVNAWYEKLRPTEEQIPERDLSKTNILPLDEIEFDMATSFGAKCSNVATMRKFGFPEGTIPNGFGVPFYFYDEFMKFNGFYEEVEEMIADPTFISDLEFRIDKLKDFRSEIKDADMPQWMLDELQTMHDSFPEGLSIRCRSSTNNEDLPGFSGAGLYTSKTQHPDEGHISKSIKQVYASMWNFRAYEERDFYRVNQYIAAMGVLCHPNFEDEKSNGVGVSLDPIYQTAGNFYLNTQVGEFLITNPDANSIPEEILLNEDPDEGFFVLRNSNLVPDGELVMAEEYLDQMRDYLRVIHDEFAILYGVVGAEGFGMDIEYKVTKDDQLIIKQARPWVSFWADIKATHDLGVIELLGPKSSGDLSSEEKVSVKIKNQGLEEMKDFDLSLIIDGEILETIQVDEAIAPQNERSFEFDQAYDFSSIKIYEVDVVVAHPLDGYEKNDTLSTLVSKLHTLEGGLSSLVALAKCGNNVELKVVVENLGADSFESVELEVVANGEVVENFLYESNILSLREVEVVFDIDENLQQTGNQITVNLINVNGVPDAVPENNSASVSLDLEDNFDLITIELNTDEYPEETSWAIFGGDNEIVESGETSITSGLDREEVCLEDDVCYTFVLYDTYGDGIFNGGGVKVYDRDGILLFEIDGSFQFEESADFCLGVACEFDVEITLENSSNQLAEDGSINIEPLNGAAPYLFSIDGGLSFTSMNVIENLPSGFYDIVVEDALGCTYEETVEVAYEMVNSIADLGGSVIEVYPNPSKGIFVLKFQKQSFNLNDLNIEVYNNLGLLIVENPLIRNRDKESIQIDLSSMPAGNYYLKCSDGQLYKEFLKVLKF